MRVVSILAIGVIGLISLGQSYAQNPAQLSIKGIVLDDSMSPIAYATISAYTLSQNDTIFITGTSTDENGEFAIRNLQIDKCFLSITHVLYKSETIVVSQKGSVNLDTIIMTQNINILGDIVITANFIDRKAGRYTVFLKGNPVTQGKTIKDVLGLFPGVSTENGISINGIGGTQTYINDRRIRDMQELESLAASNIENVEIIFNTGSAYDAQLKGGIINIKLAKIPEGGIYGSLGESIGIRPEYGITFNNINFIFNYKYRKLNIYNYIRYGNFKDIYDHYIENRYPDSGISINMKSKERGLSNTLYDNLSLLYNINDKHSIGGNLSVKFNNSNPRNFSNSLKYDYIQNFIGSSSADIYSKNHNNEFQSALNYKWLIDDKGSNFKFIADYLRNNNQRESDYNYEYIDKGITNLELIRDNQENEINMFEADAKLEFNVSDKSMWSVGMRFYSLDTKRSLLFEDMVDNDSWVKDENLSDNFNLKGEGYAAHVNFSSSVNRFSYSIGLRGQIDKISHKSYKINETNKTRYNNIFPYVNLGYALNSGKTSIINISYSRGIGYIPHSEISPAVKFETEYSYTKGNPDLAISIDNSFQFVFSVKKWNIFYDYYHIKDDIHYLTFLDEENPLITYSMPKNAGIRYMHVAGFDGNIRVTKWWNLYVNGYLRSRRTRFDEAGIKKEFNSTAFFYGINNDFSFSKWGASLNFSGETREKIDDKTMFSVYGISIGIYKYFLSKKILMRIQSQPLFSKLRNYEINKDNLWSFNRFKTPQINFSFSISYFFKSGRDVKVEQTEKIQYIEIREEKK